MVNHNKNIRFTEAKNYKKPMRESKIEKDDNALYNAMKEIAEERADNFGLKFVEEDLYFEVIAKDGKFFATIQGDELDEFVYVNFWEDGIAEEMKWYVEDAFNTVHVSPDDCQNVGEVALEAYGGADEKEAKQIMMFILDSVMTGYKVSLKRKDKIARESVKTTSNKKLKEYIEYEDEDDETADRPLYNGKYDRMSAVECIREALYDDYNWVLKFSNGEAYLYDTKTGKTATFEVSEDEDFIEVFVITDVIEETGSEAYSWTYDSKEDLVDNFACDFLDAVENE